MFGSLSVFTALTESIYLLLNWVHNPTEKNNVALRILYCQSALVSAVLEEGDIVELRVHLSIGSQHTLLHLYAYLDLRFPAYIYIPW